MPLIPLTDRTNRHRTSRWLAAILFTLAGINHFVMPGSYQKVIPPAFPKPALLVAISGIAEILGGLGLLILPLRRAAGWGLVALLVAVFPANIYMAMAPDSIGLRIPRWLLWLRLPFQPLMIWWVLVVSARPKPRLLNPG